MPSLNINTNALVVHAARLGRIGRSALPVAVRQTLNGAAYDVKTNTMPMEADVFIHRRPTFFKANSRVEQAKGFDVNSMQSTVGFIPKVGDKSHSVEDLQEQEHGGAIKGRAFVALAPARTGGSWDKNVRAKNRLGNIGKKIVDPKKNTGKGRSAFIRSAIHAGVGGFIMNQDHTRLMEIKSITRDGRDTKVKALIVDSIKRGRKAHVKPTHFMAKASDKSASKMDRMFIINAEKQIAKIK